MRVRVPPRPIRLTAPPPARSTTDPLPHAPPRSRTHMKIHVETVSPVERKVTIEVDPDRVAQEVERAYVGLGKRVKLRGFRPGKAPRKVLERHFRAEVEGEVAEKIVQQTFAEAVMAES